MLGSWVWSRASHDRRNPDGSMSSTVAGATSEVVGSNVDSNKINHIFGAVEYNLNSFVNSFGGNKESAYSALHKQQQKM